MIKEDIVDYYKTIYLLGNLGDLDEYDFLTILTNRIYEKLPFFFTDTIYECLVGYFYGKKSGNTHHGHHFIKEYLLGGEVNQVKYTFNEDVGFTEQRQETYLNFLEYYISVVDKDYYEEELDKSFQSSKLRRYYRSKSIGIYMTLLRYLGEDDGERLFAKYNQMFLDVVRESGTTDKYINIVEAMVYTVKRATNGRKDTWIDEHSSVLNM